MLSSQPIHLDESRVPEVRGYLDQSRVPEVRGYLDESRVPEGRSYLICRRVPEVWGYLDENRVPEVRIEEPNDATSGEPPTEPLSGCNETYYLRRCLRIQCKAAQES